MKERVIGVVLIGVSALLLYLCVIEPLESARQGAAKITVSLKGSILTPVGLVGLMYLAMGPRASAIMGSREKPTPVAYAVCVGVVALGLGVYLWLRSALQGYGYDFGGRF